MTKKISLLSAVAGAALLAGCSLIPNYERPAAPVADRFPGATLQDTGQPLAADTDWRDFFKDARLKHLIDTALANNRDLRVAALNVEQAGAQFRIQRAALFPAVDAQASGSRSTPNPYQFLGGGSVASQYTVGLGVTAWELDLFGRISSLKEAALAQYLATDESRNAVQVSLVSAVATGWMTVLADNELLELTRETLKTREEGLRLFQLRFDNGVISEIDLRQAESLAEGARATYAQQQRLRSQDENALALLLGSPVPPETIGGSAGALEQIAPMPDVPAGLPSDLLAERPDIRAAEQQLRSANANIGAARAAFFPRITLTGAIGTASPELSGLFDSGTKAWSFAPQVVLPIFDAGSNLANLDVAKTQRDIAVAKYEQSIQSAFREVSDALAGRATLGEQLRALRAQAKAEQTRFDLSSLRYRNGISSALDLQDAQRSLFTAQLAAVQTRLLQLQNQVVLYKALGGGWTGPKAVAGPG